MMSIQHTLLDYTTMHWLSNSVPCFSSTLQLSRHPYVIPECPNWQRVRSRLAIATPLCMRGVCKFRPALRVPRLQALTVIFVSSTGMCPVRCILYSSKWAPEYTTTAMASHGLAAKYTPVDALRANPTSRKNQYQNEEPPDAMTVVTVCASASGGQGRSTCCQGELRKWGCAQQKGSTQAQPRHVWRSFAFVGQRKLR